MAKGRKKRARVELDNAEPTPEQIEGGDWFRAGMAWRRVPVIVTLAEQGKLTARQFNGLARYRDVAIAADRSPLRSGLDFGPRGDGEGLPHFGVRMNIELGRLERALGALFDVARAVAVDDVSVSQWAMRKAGAVERTRELGKKVITWFEPSRKAHKIAMLELRMSGERLAAEIGA